MASELRHSDHAWCPGNGTDSGSVTETTSNVIPNDQDKTQNDGAVKTEMFQAPQETPITYPHGMQLIMIMVSVMISLFLTSLDQVRR